MSEAKSLTPMQAVKQDLQAMKGQFQAALPAHVSVDKFVRTVQTALMKTPDLANANRSSLFQACLAAASDGLNVDGKEAALISFKVKGVPTVMYLPMVAGILKKVRNSGELVSINAQIVYEKDEFEFYIDSEGEHINHKPEVFGDRGEMKGVYAMAITKSGGVYIEVLNMKDIASIKKASRGSNYGPWAGDFAGEMVKKSAIRRLSKRLPMSSDLEQVIKADDHLYDFKQEKTVSEKPKSLKEKMKDVTPALEKEPKKATKKSKKPGEEEI